jgi:hypothetical protein
MASIAKRPDGRWRARYRDAAGAEHSRHFARKQRTRRRRYRSICNELDLVAITLLDRQLATSWILCRYLRLGSTSCTRSSQQQEARRRQERTYPRRYRSIYRCGEWLKIWQRPDTVIS